MNGLRRRACGNGRAARTLVLLSLLLPLASCAGDEAAQGTGIALRDPAGILGNVTGDLRLLVLPAGAYPCDPATGQVTPNPPADPPDAEVGDAVVDISFPADVGATVNVRPGAFSILIRGRGEDPASMRPEQLICTGCATEMIADGETREVTIELKQVVSGGLCGDSVLSPDEQCEDGNTATGDGCSDTCRAETFLVSQRAGGDVAEQTVPAVGWAPGARAVVAYDSNARSRDVNLMVLDEFGAIITSPTALSVDTEADVLPGVQTIPAAAASGSRLGIAYADFDGISEGGDVRVRFFDGDRNPAAASELATADRTGVQSEPSLAMMSDGTALVVFEHAGSATGLAGRLFAAGSTTPSGADAFDIGAGTSGGARPSAAAHDGGFIVAFASGGDIYYQRFGADGAPIDAMALPVLEGGDLMGEQSAPTVASLSDGRTLFAWQDANPAADGAGSAIRARILDAAAAFAGPPFTVNTTTGGDQTGPVAAAGQERFALMWVSAGELRARLFDGAGNAALNREESPTSDDFVVASGTVSGPAVAAGGASGSPRWFAVWEDRSTDPTGDVMGRVFALP